MSLETASVQSQSSVDVPGSYPSRDKDPHVAVEHLADASDASNVESLKEMASTYLPQSVAGVLGLGRSSRTRIVDPLASGGGSSQAGGLSSKSISQQHVPSSDISGSANPPGSGLAEPATTFKNASTPSSQTQTAPETQLPTYATEAAREDTEVDAAAQPSELQYQNPLVAATLASTDPNAPNPPLNDDGSLASADEILPAGASDEGLAAAALGGLGSNVDSSYAPLSSTPSIPSATHAQNFDPLSDQSSTKREGLSAAGLVGSSAAGIPGITSNGSRFKEELTTPAHEVPPEVFQPPNTEDNFTTSRTLPVSKTQSVPSQSAFKAPTPSKESQTTPSHSNETPSSGKNREAEAAAALGLGGAFAAYEKHKHDEAQVTPKAEREPPALSGSQHHQATPDVVPAVMSNKSQTHDSVSHGFSPTPAAGASALDTPAPATHANDQAPLNDHAPLVAEAAAGSNQTRGLEGQDQQDLDAQRDAEHKRHEKEAAAAAACAAALAAEEEHKRKELEKEHKRREKELKEEQHKREKEAAAVAAAEEHERKEHEKEQRRLEKEAKDEQHKKEKEAAAIAAAEEHERKKAEKEAERQRKEQEKEEKRHEKEAAAAAAALAAEEERKRKEVEKEEKRKAKEEADAHAAEEKEKKRKEKEAAAAAAAIAAEEERQKKEEKRKAKEEADARAAEEKETKRREKEAAAAAAAVAAEEEHKRKEAEKEEKRKAKEAAAAQAAEEKELKEHEKEEKRKEKEAAAAAAAQEKEAKKARKAEKQHEKEEKKHEKEHQKEEERRAKELAAAEAAEEKERKRREEEEAAAAAALTAEEAKKHDAHDSKLDDEKERRIAGEEAGAASVAAAAAAYGAHEHNEHHEPATNGEPTPTNEAHRPNKLTKAPPPAVADDKNAADHDSAAEADQSKESKGVGAKVKTALASVFHHDHDKTQNEAVDKEHEDDERKERAGEAAAVGAGAGVAVAAAEHEKHEGERGQDDAAAAQNGKPHDEEKHGIKGVLATLKQEEPGSHPEEAYTHTHTDPAAHADADAATGDEPITPAPRPPVTALGGARDNEDPPKSGVDSDFPLHREEHPVAVDITGHGATSHGATSHDTKDGRRSFASESEGKEDRSRYVGTEGLQEKHHGGALPSNLGSHHERTSTRSSEDSAGSAGSGKKQGRVKHLVEKIKGKLH